MTIFYIFALIVNILFLAAILSFMRKFKILFSCKFILYLALLILLTIVVNFILEFAAKVKPNFVFWDTLGLEAKLFVIRTGFSRIIFYFLVFFIIFAPFNFAISRYKAIFAMKIREAYLISVVMGLVNAFINIMPYFCR